MFPFDLYRPDGHAELPALPVNTRLHDPSLYIPAPGLTSAVNVALALGQPLLLTGKPGTGKTELAYHVAHFFRLGEPIVFNAQTTSTAKDLFYRYDALAHFQYSQTQKEPLTPEEVERRFIHYQALGAAIRLNRRCVVLLDEIDKAPRDLPNDILAALEKLRFFVPEISKSYEADPANRPIIILTSNSEKNLPDAFLRRVVFYHIAFPDEKTLLQIVQSKVDGYSESELQAVVDHFNRIRSGRVVRLRKEPATAELIQWAALLRRLDFPAGKLADPRQLGPDDQQRLHISYSVLAKYEDDLHALQAAVW